MKKQVITTVLAIASMGLMAQAPAWIWAKDKLSGGDTYSRNVFHDAADNIYFLTSDRLCKYNSSGVNLWIKNTVDIGQMDFETDKIYTASEFTGNISVGATSYTSRSYYDMYVARWDSSFTTADWSVHFKGSKASPSDRVTPYAMKVSGGITYVVGQFDDSLFVNTTTVTPLPNNSSPCTFIAKIDASGSVVFVKTIGYVLGYNNKNVAEDMQVDASGNIYVCGEFIEAKIGGTLYTANHDFSFFGAYGDPFYLKLDNSGTPVFFRSFVGSKHEEETLRGMKIVGSNVYLAGNYTDTLHVGATQLLGTSGSSSSGFVASVDLASGTANWVKNISSSKMASAGYIVNDAAGNLYISGAYKNDMSLSGTSYSSTAANSENAFIVRLDASGNAAWLNKSGDCGIINSNRLMLLSGGDVIMAGYYIDPFSIQIGSFSLPGTGGHDHPFLARSSNAGGATGIATAGLINEACTLYPNPSSGRFMITGAEHKQVTLMTATGSVVKEYSVREGENPSFEIEQSGIYLIKITGTTGSVIKKLIVTK